MADMNALADVVVMTVKAALVPMQERQAVSDQVIKELTARVQELSALKDRVLTVETKSLREEPPPIDLAPLVKALALLEQDQEHLQAGLHDVSDLRERVVRLETKASMPLPDVPPVDLGPVLARLVALEAATASRDGVSADVAQLRERVAVLEVRPPVPGPPGPAGKDGEPGKDGTPGLSYEGTYQEGSEYKAGQITTWGGSSWHCNEVTTTKPGESKAWTLMVKRGRDGNHGRDATGVLPTVKVEPPYSRATRGE